VSDELADLLRGEDLRVLRAHYAADPRWLAEHARASLSRGPRSATAVAGALDGGFFGPGARLAAIDRERCLIFCFAGRPRDFPLAIHIYWGLMVGLDPQEVAEVLLLSGLYQGLEGARNGMRVLAGTLGLLGELAGRDPAPSHVVAAIAAAFQGGK
jgi:hypothetical protein